MDRHQGVLFDIFYSSKESYFLSTVAGNLPRCLGDEGDPPLIQGPFEAGSEGSLGRYPPLAASGPAKPSPQCGPTKSAALPRQLAAQMAPTSHHLHLLLLNLLKITLGSMF